MKRCLWKGAVSKDEYLVAKRASRHVIYAAKKITEEKNFRCIKEHDTRIFKTEEQMKMGNQDVAGKKCLLDDNDNFCFDIKSKRIVWKEYYNQLLNFF